MPDVQYFRPTNDGYATQDVGLAKGRPDLAVEIISPSSRRYDRVTKLDYYASIGVPEHWLIDVENRTVERLVLENGRCSIAQSAVDDETFEPPSFPGLALPELWAVGVPQR